LEGGFVLCIITAYQESVSLIIGSRGGFFETSAGCSAWSSSLCFAVSHLACLAGTRGRVSPALSIAHNRAENRDRGANRVRTAELAGRAHKILAARKSSTGPHAVEYFPGNRSRPLGAGVGSPDAARWNALCCNSSACIASRFMGFADSLR
jgi:hypothetical protein